MMFRLMLSDQMWSRLLLAIEDTRAYRTDNLRLIVEGNLWRFRTGAPWRDLPDQFGPWKTVFNRFNRWSKLGFWASLFNLLRGELYDEWKFIDGTYVKAHQHASGGIETTEQETIGRSWGGNTTKIHMLTDAHGNPIVFNLTAGNVHDASVAPRLIEKSAGEHSVGDKGYDSENLREQILTQRSTPHIPRKINSIKPNPHFDKYLYCHRHQVENFFARLKHFRALATRYDKLTRNFSATVFIACILVWLSSKSKTAAVDLEPTNDVRFDNYRILVQNCVGQLGKPLFDLTFQQRKECLAVQKKDSVLSLSGHSLS